MTSPADPLLADPPPADPLLDAFWERGLILFGDRVKREYALETPIFIDLRHKLYDDLETLEALGRALHRKIVELAPPGVPQQVIGVPDTATPIALAAAMASRGTDRPLSYGQLRKKPAEYPGGRWGLSAYMGVADAGREITLIDDVMASGKTKRRAIDDLARDGLRATRILVVVDREQGGYEALNEPGCSFHSLYKISWVIDYFEAGGRLDAESAQRAREHLRSRRFR